MWSDLRWWCRRFQPAHSNTAYFSSFCVRLMKRVFSSLCLALLAALVQPAAFMQAQSGIVLKTFPLKASKLLVDPSRPQLYATLPDDNSLAVINTDTNTVVTTFFIGSNPVDLAISPDGTRLYVANSGSTVAGVGVVDLTTLTVLPSLPTSSEPAAIAAGFGNRLYLLINGIAGEGTIGIAQIDATTGALQETFPTLVTYSTSGSIAISPDYKTLFVNFGEITSYDISTATPSLQQELQGGEYGGEPVISHNGQYLAAFGESTTELISAADLNDILGTVTIDSYPGVAAFSADDSRLYQVQDLGDSPYSVLKIFSTQTFTLLDSFDLFTTDAAEGYPTNITSMAGTAPGNYLYIAALDGLYGPRLRGPVAGQHAERAVLQRLRLPC